jgi:molecular chaperone DnaJ
VSFTLERREPCAACRGSGAEPGSQPAGCQTCGGHGQVMTVRDTLLGRMQTVTTCPACHGEGVVVGTPCKSCKGTGHEYRQRTIEATIPKGVEDGNILRVGGQGHSGRHGGPAGDLLVELSVEPDKRFERRGADLLTNLAVGFPDLALGATLSVPTLEGSESLRIPAGTPSHHEFILRGQGLPRLRGGGRGNLHVVVEVEVPARLSKRERELLEELRGKAASGTADSEGRADSSASEAASPKPEPKRGLFGKRRGAEG